VNRPVTTPPAQSYGITQAARRQPALQGLPSFRWHHPKLGHLGHQKSTGSRHIARSDG
jgi:hypothetical protein